MIRFPSSLRSGSVIGITAPSGGVPLHQHARLDLAIHQLKSRGYRVREGATIRCGQHKHVSAPKYQRAADFVAMWSADDIDAIYPPWGGELLIEILPLLDFNRLAESRPKWVLGYSDTSTLLFALTVRCDIATAHGTNLMDFVSTAISPLADQCLAPLAVSPGSTIAQRSSDRYQVNWVDFTNEPARAYNLTESTRWRVLGRDDCAHVRFVGRMIGGCIDTIRHLVGTPYGDLSAFKRRNGADGIVMYLENCELSPPDLARSLWGMRLAGWFDGIAGLVLGRSSGPEAKDPAHLTQDEALLSVLSDLGVPVIIDADIGHRPPQLTIVNGAVGEWRCEDGAGSLRQTLA